MKKMKQTHKTSALLAILLALICSFVMQPGVNAAPKWKKLYTQYLNTDDWCTKAATKGRFVYINNDKIPELFLEGNCAAAGNKLLTIYKGKVVENYIDGHSAIDYVEKKGICYVNGGHMDYYYDTVGRLVKGNIKLGKGGTYGASNNANVKYDKKGNPVYEYYWQKKKVSEKTYKAKLKKLKGNYKYKSCYVYEKMLTIDQVKAKLK